MTAYNPVHKLFNYLLDLFNLAKSRNAQQETITLKLFFRT